MSDRQLPGRFSTMISGLTCLPSGNGRLSGTSTARVERKVRVRQRDYLCQERTEKQQNVIEKAM